MSKSLSNILNESLDLERAIIESMGEITPAIADQMLQPAINYILNSALDKETKLKVLAVLL